MRVPHAAAVEIVHWLAVHGVECANLGAVLVDVVDILIAALFHVDEATEVERCRHADRYECTRILAIEAVGFRHYQTCACLAVCVVV